MTRRTIARALVYLSLIVATLVVLLPLVVVLLTSLKSEKEMADTSGALELPHDLLNFHNYVTAFQDGEMLSAFTNTAIILLISIGGTVLIGSMTAYAIDRFTFRFKKLVVVLFLTAALVPGVTTQVATFQIVNSFGMFDSLWAPIALYMGTDIVSIYIFLQFVRSIPVSLDESARLDGANAFTIYRKIIFPLLKPHDRDRGDREGDHRLQRLLHPLPLHALGRSWRDLDVAVPLPRPLRGPLGSHFGRSGPGDPADPDRFPEPAKVHLQRFHARRDQVSAISGGAGNCASDHSQPAAAVRRRTPTAARRTKRQQEPG